MSVCMYACTCTHTHTDRHTNQSNLLTHVVDNKLCFPDVTNFIYVKIFKSYTNTTSTTIHNFKE